MNQKITNLKSNIFISTLISIIILLLIIMLIYYPKSNQNVFDDSNLRDSIKLLQNQIDSSKIKQQILENQYDSLLALPPKIKYKTNEKIKFIYYDASPSDLDSIIRSNWKTGIRHD